MDKKNMIELLEKIEQTGLSDLRSELDEEMNKPSDERDLIKIRDLIDSISEIEGDDSDGAFRRQKAQIKERVKADRSIRITRRRKQLAALAACAVVLFGLNQASLNAYGENVFKRAYHFTKGGVSIMIGENDDTEPTEPPTAPPATDASAPEEEVIELPTYPGDPYGIKAVCAEYGLYPMVPTYIPEGFKLVDLSENDSSISMHLVFRFVKEEKRINLYYIYPKDENDSFALPTDSGNIMELTINNQLFTVSNDNNLSKAFYIDGKMICNLCTYNLEYNETNKILHSFS